MLTEMEKRTCKVAVVRWSEVHSRNGKNTSVSRTWRMRRDMAQCEDGEAGNVHLGACRLWILVSTLRSLGSTSSFK